MCKGVKYAFENGPYSEMCWMRRKSFITTMVCCNFQPLLYRKLESLILNPPLKSWEKIPPIVIKTKEDRHKFLLMKIFGNDWFWRIICSYI